MLKETPLPAEHGSAVVNSNSETRNSSSLSRSVSSSLSITEDSIPVSPTEDSPNVMKTSSSRIESLKNWSISTYKCTKQLMFEKLGKTSRTVDAGNVFLIVFKYKLLIECFYLLELESQIEQLRDTQRKYLNILRLTRALTNHFYHVVQTQV